METVNTTRGTRPAKRFRLIDHSGAVVAYPEPHRAPVLPSGWAPLSRDQQEAVQRACDSVPECLILKLGPLWEAGSEYRAYRLPIQNWAGLSVVCRYGPDVRAGSESNQAAAPSRNVQLLGLAWEPLTALRIAADFFNWDLEAHGLAWRLSVHDAHVEHS